MVLESTMVVVDNSDFMRNGDFIPTRLQAQQDAVGMVCQSKVRSNPENNVGLVVMSKVEVLVTLTQDVGRILTKLHQVQPSGLISFATAIKVAHLALKHRQGRNHRTRIVVFVGSPMADTEKDIVKLAKKLKKEKVNVDIVNFGEECQNTDKLTTFINTLNGAEGKGSHLVTVPPGPILSDALVSSPVILGEEGTGVSAGMAGAGFEFGIDPNEDPELALALRVSMEEQRARQEAESRRANVDAAKESQPLEATKEESNLEAAMAESLQSGLETPGPAPRDVSAMSEEEQIAYALQMSLAPSDKDAMEQMMVEEDNDEDDDEPGDMISDPEFLQSVLFNLPGVDPESEAIRNAVQSLTRSDGKKDEENKGNDSRMDDVD